MTQKSIAELVEQINALYMKAPGPIEVYFRKDDDPPHCEMLGPNGGELFDNLYNEVKDSRLYFDLIAALVNGWPQIAAALDPKAQALRWSDGGGGPQKTPDGGGGESLPYLGGSIYAGNGGGNTPPPPPTATGEHLVKFKFYDDEWKCVSVEPLPPDWLEKKP